MYHLIAALLTKYISRAHQVLEVGAINTQLKVVPWLNVRAVDLNSQV